jgi:hypothetical protein
MSRSINPRWVIGFALTALGLAAVVPASSGAASAVASVTAGDRFSCARRADGTVVCWGSQLNGEVSGVPPTQFTQVSAGNLHACGVKIDERAICWGADFQGRVSGVPSTSLFRVVSSGGHHSCGVKTDRTLACWGSDADWQISTTPGGALFTAVASGTSHNCALKTDQTVVCWGSNAGGQASAPTDTTFTSIGAGDGISCGLTTEAAIECWGGGSPPQYGLISDIPTGTFSAIAVGGYHVCALRTNGTPVCWGYDGFGEVSTTPTTTPFSSIEAGLYHTCGVLVTGGVKCWGWNDAGQLGEGPAVPSPTPPAGTEGIPYGHTFTSSLGSLGGTFSVTSGTLPPGLTLTATGLLSGAPSAAGSYSFTVTADDGVFVPARASFVVSIGRDTTPPVGTCVGPAPAFTLRGAGGSVAATFTDTAPALQTVWAPVSGTANVGNYTLTLAATDAAGNVGYVDCPYRIAYRFGGFTAPLPKTSVNAGASLPVKFTLADASGAAITANEAQALAATCKVTVRLRTGGTTGCAQYEKKIGLFQYDLKLPKAGTGGPQDVIVQVSAPNGSGALGEFSTQITVVG